VDGDSISARSQEFRLPQGVRVTELGSQGRGEANMGMEYFRNGTSSTYGLRLELSGTATYLCILGMGGQAVRVPTEAAAKEVLSNGR
jgi:hypothetical protein